MTQPKVAETSNECSPDFHYFSTNTADIDLQKMGADGQGISGYAATLDPGRPCRAIRANTAGNISVVTPRGNTEIIPFAAGETQSIRATKITTSGTTVAIGITIFW
jgi:hypothetical protein